MDTYFANKYAERETQLFSLGMSKNQFGFAFHDIHVLGNDLIHMIDRDWNEFILNIKKSISVAKKTIDLQITDKQKLQNFCNSLGQVTGPELKNEKARELLEGCLFLVGQAREFLNEEVARLS